MVRNKLIIKNAALMYKSENRVKKNDILIDESGDKRIILDVGPDLRADDARTVNVYGNTLFPAFFDTWSRMGETGREECEDYSSGTNSAVYGGFGTVLILPFGNVITDCVSALNKRIREASKQSRCSVLFSASLTLGCNGTELCDYKALSEAGAVAFTDGMNERCDDTLLFEAMKRLAAVDALLMVTPQRFDCYKNSQATLGRMSRLMNLKGIPASAEAVSISRYLFYACETGCRIHVSGVSTAASVKLIAAAKENGIRVTASAFPSSFIFCENDLPFYGQMVKVWPPLRTADDKKAVIEALRDGVIDCIASDHSPCFDREKPNDFAASEFGTVSLQTVFSAAYTYLVSPGHISVFRLSELLSDAPAAILGLDPPEIKIGAEADFNLASLDRDFIVSENYLKSKARNSVFSGMTMYARIEDIYTRSSFRQK